MRFKRSASVLDSWVEMRLESESCWNLPAQLSVNTRTKEPQIAPHNMIRACVKAFYQYKKYIMVTIHKCL